MSALFILPECPAPDLTRARVCLTRMLRCLEELEEWDPLKKSRAYLHAQKEANAAAAIVEKIEARELARRRAA